MKTFFLLALLVLSAGFAQATVVEFSLVKIVVEERGDALVSHLISYDSRSGSEVSFKVLDNKNFRIFDNLGELEFKETDKTVSFFPRDFVENYGVTIEYSSSALTSKQGKNWFFEFGFVPQNDFEELKFELALPKQAALSSYEPPALVFLGDQSLELEWTFENTSKEPVNLKAQYFFSENGEEDTTENLNPIFLVGVLIAIIAVIGIGGAYFYFSSKSKKKGEQIKVKNEAEKKVKKSYLTDQQRDLMKILNENEEKVVKELLKEDNIAQRNLMAKTGLPKSTLSRTLKKLELKGLIKVINIGITNKIELSKEFREK